MSCPSRRKRARFHSHPSSPSRQLNRLPHLTLDVCRNVEKDNRRLATRKETNKWERKRYFL